MKRTFFGELYHRWLAETPSFFKKLRTFGLSLLALGTALLGINQALPKSIHMPAMLISIAEKFLWIGPSLSAVATLVVKPEYVEAVKEKGSMVPTVQEIKESKEESKV